MEDFCVELADVPFRIVCRHPENREFFKDYLSEKAPLFTLSPTDADLEAEWAAFVRRDAKRGFAPQPRGGVFLENSAIYTQTAVNLANFGVLQMHGSALCMDGRAYVFTALSGTGKSTHARLWREAFGDRVWMINDDKPLIRVLDDGAKVYGSPWDGKHHLSRNASAPLRAVAQLERGRDNRVEPLKKADAYALLIRHCYVSDAPANRLKVSRLEAELLGKAEFCRLFCNMDPDAALTAYRGMNGEYPG
ncbi:MAG: hypothetical protein J6U72_02220 [Clostridia bacterium]|nr:hypothetical protein [Clostridia bacterium]